MFKYFCRENFFLVASSCFNPVQIECGLAKKRPKTDHFGQNMALVSVKGARGVLKYALFRLFEKMFQRSPNVQVLLSREFFPRGLKLLQPGPD